MFESKITKGPWLPYVGYVEGEGYPAFHVKSDIEATPDDMHAIKTVPELLEIYDKARDVVNAARDLMSIDSETTGKDLSGTVFSLGDAIEALENKHCKETG